MAIRSEDLHISDAEAADILRFPTAAVRRRAARQARVAVVRRRVVLGAFFVLLVAGVILSGGSGVSSPTDAGGPRAVTVAPGETLWDIAQRYGPAEGDPRAYIYEIQQLNDLHGAPAAGARLELPR